MRIGYICIGCMCRGGWNDAERRPDPAIDVYEESSGLAWGMKVGLKVSLYLLERKCADPVRVHPGRS